LALDFSIPIIFMNIFLNTISCLRDNSIEIEEGEERLQLVEEEGIYIQQQQQQQQQVESQSSTTKQRFTRHNESCYKNDRIHHPYQLLMLVVASIVHVFGNLWLTLIPFSVVS